MSCCIQLSCRVRELIDFLQDKFVGLRVFPLCNYAPGNLLIRPSMHKDTLPKIPLLLISLFSAWVSYTSQALFGMPIDSDADARIHLQLKNPLLSRCNSSQRPLPISTAHSLGHRLRLSWDSFRPRTLAESPSLHQDAILPHFLSPRP